MTPIPARSFSPSCVFRFWQKVTGGLPVLMAWLGRWRRRARTRRQLGALPDHLLADIGLSRPEGRCESARPFWRG